MLTPDRTVWTTTDNLPRLWSYLGGGGQGEGEGGGGEEEEEEDNDEEEEEV